MTVRNIFVDSWVHASTAGITIFVLALMALPFLISLIANIGRPVPVALRRTRQRLLPSPHSRVSSAGLR
ncbi:MAG TPA: hypothetical protein VG942_16660 [Hyphomonadaceae bacterium]|nr:hypothetical protein [Hyphomonadaceae bacterium]